MIGRLRGLIVYKQPPELMLEVSGVGYELNASMTTFADLPDINQETTLFTHFIVREDAQILYAFSSINERALFRTLLKVNGVGPKMALAIVSGMTVHEFVAFVGNGDSTALTRLPGVGKKTAERLVIEMRDRLSEFAPSSSASEATTNQPVPLAMVNHEEEAVNALLALGYKPAIASRMISQAKAASDEGASVESLIRHALKKSLS